MIGWLPACVHLGGPQAFRWFTMDELGLVGNPGPAVEHARRNSRDGEIEIHRLP
jgi:hypothetical protein